MRFLDRLASRLYAVEQQLRGMATTPQLANSSIEDAGINEYDGDGVIRATIGRQFDDTRAAAIFNGPAPPVPSTPLLTAETGSLIARWDGEWADGAIAPMDFARVEIHASTNPAFDPTLAESLVSTIETPRGGEVTIPGIPGTTYYVRLVARSLAGTASPASEQASTAPLNFPPGVKVYSQDTTPAGTDHVDGSIWIDTDDGNRQYVWSDLTDTWVSRQFGNGAISPGSLVASNVIATGTITAPLLQALLVLASRVVVGDPVGARIDMDGTTNDFRAYRPGGTVITLHIDGDTGNVTIKSVGANDTLDLNSASVQMRGISDPDGVTLFENGQLTFTNDDFVSVSGYLAFTGDGHLFLEGDSGVLLGSKIRPGGRSPSSWWAVNKKFEDGGFVSTNSLSPVSLGTAPGTPAGVFIAPPSGEVLVKLRCQMVAAVAGTSHCVFGFEVRDGSTIGSGTIIKAADTTLFDTCELNAPNTVAGTISVEVPVIGLTAGNTYNIRGMYWRNSGVDAGFARRRIIVEPQLITY